MRNPPSYHPRLVWLLCLTFIFSPSLRAETAPEVSDEECAIYGKQLADFFNSHKSAEIVHQLDGYSLVDRIFQGLEVDDAFKAEFRTGYIPSLTTSLTHSFRVFTKARYLRLQSLDGDKRVLIRCISAEGAVNFMAFVVARRASGTLKWLDAYTYINGELLSESSRRAILPVLVESKKNLFAKLTSKESAFVKSFPKITEVTELIKKGKVAEAHAILEALPAEVKSNRFILTLRLRVGQKIDEKAYMTVITDWEKAFPGDPSLDLISIDGDFMRKDFAGGIKRLNRLSERLGGDNYLVYLKGNLQMLAGDYSAARNTARAVIAAEPAIAGAWDTLLGISLTENKYAETVTLLDEIEAMYSGTNMKPVIDKSELYAAFRESSEYQGWAAKKVQSLPVIASPSKEG